MLTGIIKYSHHLLEKSITEGECVIDATCGNGNDTLFLSKLVGDSGRVYAFDIQEQAINNSKNLLNENGKTNVTFIQDNHANLNKYIAEHGEKEIGAAIFNLGYLPRSDKEIITKGDSSIKAINSILSLLKKDGLIVLVVYHGHEGGAEEKEMILKHVIQLDQKDYSVLQYGFINQKNKPPFILAIQKR